MESQKNNNSLIILLSILLFISLLVAGLFAFKTQKLVKELTVYRLQSTATQTPTPTDPTADLSRAESKDWKTYIIDDWNASIKSPYQPNIDQGLFIGTKRRYELAKSNPCPTIVSEAKNMCLIPGKNWYQTNDIQRTKLTEKPAVSFFVFDPNKNSVLHVLQTTENPVGEISVAVDGMGGEETFQQILSTFKFLDDSPEATKIPLKTLKYNLPQGWSTTKYFNNDFEVGYDSNVYETKVIDVRNDKNSLWIVKKDSMTPYSNSFIFSLLPYDGGSRHKFIYNQIGETPTKDDLYKDYKELEYNISGKSCLILDGITISQYPVVWTMCAVGDKAILMTTFDRSNYLSILQTLKIN